jgi:hypothetical protein
MRASRLPSLISRGELLHVRQGTHQIPYPDAMLEALVCGARVHLQHRSARCSWGSGDVARARGGSRELERAGDDHPAFGERFVRWQLAGLAAPELAAGLREVMSDVAALWASDATAVGDTQVDYMVGGCVHDGSVRPSRSPGST